MAGISTWRANDVVEYDAMRESATLLTALLLLQGNYETTLKDIAELRDDVSSVDAYDRAAVAELAARITKRIVDFPRVTS